jgi:hypothetical protein
MRSFDQHRSSSEPSSASFAFQLHSHGDFFLLPFQILFIFINPIIFIHFEFANFVIITRKNAHQNQFPVALVAVEIFLAVDAFFSFVVA